MNKPLKVLLGTVVLAFGIPAMAQTQAGLVNVDVSDVKADIAKNINIDVSKVPVTVQAPVAVAATVCNVAANVLAENKQGASCKATTTNQALNQIVQREAGDKK